MKIFSAEYLRKADEITIHKQGITSFALMERAAAKVFEWLKSEFTDKETTFHIFCGQGNNGGDGLVVARLLKEQGYRVTFTIVKNTGTPTEDFAAALIKARAAEVKETDEILLPENTNKLVIVDAIFGTGLNREMSNDVKNIIESINESEVAIISIDVPSGMFLEQKTNIAVIATHLLTFQLPKLAFYLSGNYKYIKSINILDIGLDKEFIENNNTDYHLTDSNEAVKRFRPLSPYAHKGTQGHALIIGGSHGKIGAACLSAKAALKSGCGLVTGYIPNCGYEIMQSYIPEAMVVTNGEKHLQQIKYNIKADAVGIGMGIGKEQETQEAFYNFLANRDNKLVIDADALTILALHKEWLTLLPEQTILTPHPKELERLIGNWEDDFDKLEKLKAFSIKYKCIIVAKDARTMIVHGNKVYINNTGNAALATGGSGDVLTGIITSLLAQNYTSEDAAVFGVYLHGFTADIAVKKMSAQAFTASTIIKYLSKAYLHIEAHYGKNEKFT